MFASLILLCSSPISKIPTKNSPNFFVICWFDEVLLILIHGFAWFRVDLACPQFSPPSIHRIHQILPLESSISAPNSKISAPNEIWIRRAGHPGQRLDISVPGRTSGSWSAKSARFWTSGPGFPAPTPDVRPLTYQPPQFHRFVHN